MQMQGSCRAAVGDVKILEFGGGDWYGVLIIFLK
jgi:hypothetical protein